MCLELQNEPVGRKRSTWDINHVNGSLLCPNEVWLILFDINLISIRASLLTQSKLVSNKSGIEIKKEKQANKQKKTKENKSIFEIYVTL